MMRVLKKYLRDRVVRVVRAEVAALTDPQNRAERVFAAEVASLQRRYDTLEASIRGTPTDVERVFAAEVASLQRRCDTLEASIRGTQTDVERLFAAETAGLQTRCDGLDERLHELRSALLSAHIAARRDGAAEMVGLTGAFVPVPENAAAQIDKLKRQVGHLKTNLDDSKYWINLYRWRWQALCNAHWGSPSPTTPPPREIPDHLLAGFSMNGRVPVEYVWADETRPSNWPLIYTDAEIDSYLHMIRHRVWNIYGTTDGWLWDALDDFPIQGKTVAIIGSTTPWYESVCIHYGGHPVTVEYNRIEVKSPRMEALSADELKRSPRLFDAAISISSFEHDGLGRYGDPIDPDADLKAMRQMMDVVRPGGFLYLAVPVGRDRVVFNHARTYGPVRFPLLVDGWEEVRRYGFALTTLEDEGSIQPVIVLRNRG